MKVTIEYCGQLRQITGRDLDMVEHPGPLDVEALLVQLAGRYEQGFRGMVLNEHGAARASLLVAVNGSAADRKARRALEDGDVVTLLPPIGGG